MKKVVVPSILCIALVPLAAGCGSSDKKKSDTGASTGASTQAQTSTSGGGGGGTASVSIKDIKFNPHDITVKKGTTITWKNNDQVQHTVVKRGGPGPTFNGSVAPGQTFKQTFTTAGKIPYVCTIHPGQTGTITVQ
jgi:plastocyanin